MELTFRTRNDKQLLAAERWVDDSTEEILYGGAKGGGKSFLGASLIFGDALVYPETHYFIARKELNDLRKFTIPTIHEVFAKFGIKLDDYARFNGQDSVYELRNGSKVFLITCKDEPSDPLFERFGSMQMTRGWIEEGGEVPENAKANLWLSIGRWKNDVYGLKKKLLVTANPKKGWMKRDFVEPYALGKLSHKRAYIQALATDNPYLPPDYVDSLRADRDPVRRQRLWEGNWDYDDDKDSLISADALTDAFSSTIDKDGKKYLIVDVARLGRDSTVFSFWDGLQLYRIEAYQKQTTDTTEQQVKDFAAAERIPYSNILVDEDGIGGGVVDHLFGVKGFTANSSPIPTAHVIRERFNRVAAEFLPKPTYSNLKSQCGWKLAELINERGIALYVLPYRDRIIEELTALLRDKAPDGEGRKRLRPKDEVKTEIGRSPDIGDTIIMRAYFELLKESTGNYDAVHAKAAEEQSVLFSRNRNRQHLNSTQ